VLLLWLQSQRPSSRIRVGMAAHELASVLPELVYGVASIESLPTVQEYIERSPHQIRGFNGSLYILHHPSKRTGDGHLHFEKGKLVDANKSLDPRLVKQFHRSADFKTALGKLPLGTDVRVRPDNDQRYVFFLDEENRSGKLAGYSGSLQWSESSAVSTWFVTVEMKRGAVTSIDRKRSRF